MHRSILVLALLLCGCPVNDDPTFEGDLGQLSFTDSLGGDHDAPVLLGTVFELSHLGFDPLYSAASGVSVLATTTCDGRGEQTGTTIEDLGNLVDDPFGVDFDLSADCETTIRVQTSEAGVARIDLHDDEGELIDTVRYTVRSADDATLSSVRLSSFLPVSVDEDTTWRLFAGQEVQLELRLLGEGDVLRFGIAVETSAPSWSATGHGPTAGVQMLIVTAGGAGSTSALRVEAPEGNPAFETLLSAVGEDGIDDVRIRLDGVDDQDQERCFELEGYGRQEGNIVHGVPLDWYAALGVGLTEDLPGRARACLLYGGKTWAGLTGDWDGAPYQQRYLDAFREADPQPDAPAGTSEPAVPETGCSVAGAGGGLAGLLLLVARRRQ